jgi:hypothetical protein
MVSAEASVAPKLNANAPMVRSQVLESVCVNISKGLRSRVVERMKGFVLSEAIYNIFYLNNVAKIHLCFYIRIGDSKRKENAATRQH